MTDTQMEQYGWRQAGSRTLHGELEPPGWREQEVQRRRPPWAQLGPVRLEGRSPTCRQLHSPVLGAPGGPLWELPSCPPGS